MQPLQQERAEAEIQRQASEGGPFVAAVKATRMPMVVTDPAIDGNPIIYANDAFLALTGYTQEEVLGQNYHFLIGPATDPHARERIDRALAAQSPIDLEVELRAKHDRPIWVAQFVSPVMNDHGMLVQHFASFLDITRRKMLEEELRQSTLNLERRVAARTEKLEASNAKLQAEVERRQALEEVLRASLDEKQELVSQKDFLIREVHHRVKNSFQIGISLLSAQASRVQEPSVRDALNSAVGRIERLADLHELLYQSEDMGSIDVHEYLENLARGLIESAGAADHVRLDFDSDELCWHSGKLLPLALIVNEAMTNALKHAFPEKRAGTIKLCLHQLEGANYRLCVSDDGIGMRSEHREGSLGMKLINMFARQIGGVAQIRGNAGTTVEIFFRA